MNMIKGIVRNGQIEVEYPIDLPDGTTLCIPLIAPWVTLQEPVSTEQGRRDNEKDTMSVEEIARTLAAMDHVEGFEMSDTEEAAWHGERKARKEREKARFEEHAAALRRHWE